MKKIPTLFPKNPNNLRLVIPGDLKANLEKVKAFIKYDGRACAIINNKLYTRYDAKLIKRKRGKLIKLSKDEIMKKIPEGAIQCQEPDKKSGHWPHWVPCDSKNKDYEYIFEAYENSKELYDLENGTYECIGPKVNGNPHHVTGHFLIPHLKVPIENFDEKFYERIKNIKKNPEKLYDFFKEYFKTFPFEGIVFWDLKKMEPVAKIRKTDFGWDKWYEK